MSLRIEQAANGYIVHRMGGILTSDDLKRPMVFDSFERMVDWLAEHFREGPVSVTRPRPRSAATHARSRTRSASARMPSR